MIKADELLKMLNADCGEFSIEALSRVLFANYIQQQVECKSRERALNYVKNVIEFLELEGDEVNDFWLEFNEQHERYIINSVDILFNHMSPNMDAEYYDDLLADVVTAFARTLGDPSVAWKPFTVKQILEYDKEKGVKR